MFFNQMSFLALKLNFRFLPEMSHTTGNLTEFSESVTKKYRSGDRLVRKSDCLRLNAV